MGKGLSQGDQNVSLRKQEPAGVYKLRRELIFGVFFGRLTWCPVKQINWRRDEIKRPVSVLRGQDGRLRAEAVGMRKQSKT